MISQRRYFEEMTLSLLIKQVSTESLQYFISIYIDNYSNLSFEMNTYITKHIIPLLILNFTTISQNKIASEDQLEKIKSFHNIAKQTHEVYSKFKPNEFIGESFKDFLKSLQIIDIDTPEPDIKLIFAILRDSKDMADKESLFLNEFYLHLKPKIQNKVINMFFNEKNNKLVLESICKEFESKGFPGIVYAPIQFIGEKKQIDLIDTVIEIETSYEELKEGSIKKRYLSSTTVYDFFTQIMLHYNINIELYTLYYNNEISIEVKGQDFNRTIEQLLSDNKIEEVNSAPIRLTIKPLGKISEKEIYFNANTGMLSDPIQRLFDLWWNRIILVYNIQDTKINNHLLRKALQCQIQDKDFIESIDKVFKNEILPTKDNVIELIKQHSPCLLHFIIGFTYDKENTVSPYLRNTIFINVPRFCLYYSSADDDYNAMRYFPLTVNEDNSQQYLCEYQPYFTYWLNLKKCSSVYMITPLSNDANQVKTFNSLMSELNQLSKGNKEYSNKINIISKILLEEVNKKSKGLVLDSNIKKMNDVPSEYLFQNEYLFKLFYTIVTRLVSIDLNTHFPLFCKNYLRLYSEASKEVKEIATSFFTHIKKNIVCYFNPNWFEEIIGNQKEKVRSNKLFLLWEFIEITTLFKKRLFFKFDDFDYLIPPKDIIAYLRNPKEANANTNLTSQRVIYYLIFAGTYYNNIMIINEKEFNKELKQLFLDASKSNNIQEPLLRYCLYYYLIKTNQLQYPIIPYFSSCTNMSEVHLSSIILQLYSIDLVQFNIYSSLISNASSTNSKDKWLNLFNALSQDDPHPSMSNYTSTLPLDKLINGVIDDICKEITGLRNLFNPNELMTEYSNAITYTSNILILKNNEVLDTIQNRDYILKGYWIEVNKTLNMYHCYVRINHEWFLYTTSLRKVHRSEMITTPLENSKAISVYVKSNEKEEVNTELPMQIVHPDIILLDECIKKFPYTMVEMCYSNPFFISSFLKSHERLVILKDFIQSLNNKDVVDNKNIKGFCFNLLVNSTFESEVNEYFNENVIQFIKRSLLINNEPSTPMQ